MKQNNSLKNELKTALNEIGVVTKKDLTGMGVVTKKDLDSAKSELKKELASKKDLQKLERSLKRRMGQERIKTVVSIGKLALNTPTKKEFDELKDKVNRLHPAY